MPQQNSLYQNITDVNPDILNRKLEKWDVGEFQKISPFVIEHYWHSNASINVFRVIGTQHLDYVGLTWLEFLKVGKRMSLNLKLHETNPQYYYAANKKDPTMFYKSVDGGDFYVGDDGNHRTCIAKADFFLSGKTVLHGVTVDDYRIDWALKKKHDDILDIVASRRLPYIVSAHTALVSRDDSGGWMLEKYSPKIKAYNIKNRKEVMLDALAADSFIASAKNSRLFRRIFVFST